MGCRLIVSRSKILVLFQALNKSGVERQLNIQPQADKEQVNLQLAGVSLEMNSADQLQT